MHETNITSFKIRALFLTELDKLVLKCGWKSKEFRIVNTILKKNKVDELILLNFITHYEATVIGTAWYWHKDQHIY